MKEHFDESIGGATVLDMGCGDGRLSCWLAAKGPRRVVAADVSPMAVEKAMSRARAHALSNVDGKVEDVQALTFPANSFDVVVACEVVERTASPATAIQEIARVMRPGAALYLTMPNHISMAGLPRAYRKLRGRPQSDDGQPPSHTVFPLRARRWVQRADLEVMRIDLRGYSVPVPGRAEGPLPVQLPMALTRVLRWFGEQSVLVARKPQPRR